MSVRNAIVLSVLCILGACGDANQNEPIGEQGAALWAPVTTHGFPYHGGVVMSGTVHVYLIFYGSIPSTVQSQMEQFVDGIDWVEGPNQPWNIVTTYYDSTGARASNDLRFSGYTVDTSYLQGTNNPNVVGSLIRV